MNRIPFAVSLALVLGARTVAACVPSPTASSIPCGIILVGSAAGIADTRGQFMITVRGFNAIPVPGSSVVIDFNACSADIRVCSVQSGADATVDGSGAVGLISGVTDASGTVVMRVCGGARNTTPGAPGAAAGCAIVYADGVNLGTMTVSTFDEKSSGGVGPADISQFLADEFRFPGVYVGRSDFNCTNTIDPADLSLLLSASLGAGSTSSCSAYTH